MMPPSFVVCGQNFGVLSLLRCPSSKSLKSSLAGRKQPTEQPNGHFPEKQKHWKFSQAPIHSKCCTKGDRPCSCDHFEMRLTSVRPSVQKLSAFEIKNIYLHAYSRNLVDFSAKIFRKVHRKCMCQQFPTCPFTNTLHSTIFLDPILPSTSL